MYALPCRNLSTRSEPCSCVPRSASHSLVPEDELAPPGFVDGEMRLASVELPVLFGKLVSIGDF